MIHDEKTYMYRWYVSTKVQGVSTVIAKSPGLFYTDECAPVDWLLLV